MGNTWEIHAKYIFCIFVEAVTNKLTFGYAGVQSLCVLNVDNARDYQSDLVGVIPGEYLVPLKHTTNNRRSKQRPLLS